MHKPEDIPEVSVIVPARNEARCLADCLRTLVSQQGAAFEVIVADDHSADDTRAIAESFPVRVISAGALPAGWTGKANAAWCGARAAKGKWLLFTDADTKHSSHSIATGVQDAIAHSAGMLSYSPRQEVHGFAERALMPLIFAELATMYPPKEVCDPNSAVAAANGQYLLIRRDVYDAIGGHAAVAGAILEDVELAKLVKAAGYGLRFRISDEVSTRMYRGIGELWEGWTKNLALLFPNPRGIALRRASEFAAIAVALVFALVSLIKGDMLVAGVAAVVTAEWLDLFLKRIQKAHFDWRSNVLAYFGLPLFAVLLLNSYISHKRGSVRWKGRAYAGGNRLVAEKAAKTLPAIDG
jgi:hypothetical protein